MSKLAPPSPSTHRPVDLQTAGGLPISEVPGRLGSRDDGLTSSEAADRQRTLGRNVLASRRMTAFAVLVRQLRNPLLILLLAAAAISAVTGDATDAVIVATIVLSVGLQASRWDRIKDPVGVMHGFAEYVDGATPAHLALVGPAVHGVADDPGAAEVLDECVQAWQALPHAVRSRVHLGCVPMHDPDEAAIIVNALQRHATVVVQKSLAEGFALTVSEAMWKTRPVVGTRVGGIADQVIHGETGLLVNDPHDLEAFGSAVHRLLDEPSFATQLGKAGHARAYTEFLQDRHLEEYAALFAKLEYAR